MVDFFSGRRPSTHVGRAMIATSHPLATAAGLAILQEGGSAVDAGVAALAVQCVVDPLMTGVGGDCFALYKPFGKDMQALNGSGRTPQAATLAAIRERVHGEEIPQTSPHSVTIPGAVAAWSALHAAHGRLRFDRLFDRAIGYAVDGYVITSRVALDWKKLGHVVDCDEHARALFRPNGKAPAAGERHRQPKLGGLLSEIASDGPEAFYGGRAAESMVDYLRSQGGLHTIEDFRFAQTDTAWTLPISRRYRGFDVHECPPNGQGVAALMILKIIEGFNLATMSTADRIHLMAEATKLAYHHRDALLGDIQPDALAIDELLSDDVVRTLRARIDMSKAMPPALWDEPEHSDTVYISVVDEEGNALSLINSIFKGFGSARLDPGTGVLFHNRGSSFRLLAGHPNAIAPRKRPMHTIIPGMVTRDGAAVMSFGVMGGHYQATGHAALLSDVFDRGLDLQAAMDEPRSFAFGGVLEIEPTISSDVRDQLRWRGHVLKIATSPIGGSQAIRILNGALEGGSDSRKDGMALGF